jgi:hypothetical protein
MSDSDSKELDFGIDIEQLVKDGRAKVEISPKLDCDIKILIDKKFWLEISGRTTFVNENKEDEDEEKKCSKCGEMDEPVLCELENTLKIFKFCKWPELKTCKKFIRDKEGNYYCKNCLDEMENPPCFCYDERAFCCDESCAENLSKFYKSHSLCDCYNKATNEKENN